MFGHIRLAISGDWGVVVLQTFVTGPFLHSQVYLAHHQRWQGMGVGNLASTDLSDPVFLNPTCKTCRKNSFIIKSPIRPPSPPRSSYLLLPDI